MSRLPGRVVALLVALNILWAGSAVAAKAALGQSGAPGYGPFTVAFLRFGLSVPLLWLLMKRQDPSPRWDRNSLALASLAGMLGIFLTYSVQYAGMRWTTASEVSLLIAAEPVLIALLAYAFLGERQTRSQRAGLLAGFVGVYLIIGGGPVPRFGGSTVGNILVTLAISAECCAGIIGRFLVRRFPGLAVVVVEMAVGSLLLLPFALLEIFQRGTLVPSIPALVGMLYLFLACSLIGYGAWYYILPRYQISTMAGFLFLQPVGGAALGALLMGDRPGFWTLGGAAMVLFGVGLVTRAARSRA